MIIMNHAHHGSFHQTDRLDERSVWDHIHLDNHRQFKEIRIGWVVIKERGALVSGGGLSHGWSTGPTRDGTLSHTVTPRLKPHK